MSHLTPEEERDIFKSTVEAVIISFDKLAKAATDKANLLREILEDPDANSEWKED